MLMCLKKHSSFAASRLFHGIAERNWFRELPSKHGNAHETLISFAKNNAIGERPTKFLLCNALNCCASTCNWHLGLQIHAQVFQSGYAENLFLNSSLINVYSKCGVLVNALKVFDEIKSHDQVSWTSIISACSQNGYGKEAIHLFKEMLGVQVKPNCFTYVSVISGCTELETITKCGMPLHAHVTKLRYEINTFVVSSLIDIYSKCGQIDQAAFLFELTAEKDTILVNSMITGYSRNLFGEEALKIFVEMRNGNMSPSEHTLTSILDACGSLATLLQGKQMHALVLKLGSDSNVFVACALVNMYSKCGDIAEACCIFDQTRDKNVVLWTSMITCFAQSGRALDALKLFDDLILQKKFTPDHLCFTAVLTACNHAGFIDRGIEYFERMQKDFDLVPEMDHYACLVDLYARTGNIQMAKKVMEKMPLKPNAVIWSSFLSSCKEYGEVDLGREAAHELFNLNPHSTAPYLALADIFGGAGLLDEMVQLKALMKQKGLMKSVGWSWIEVENKVHVFLVNDLTHPQTRDIYAELKCLNFEMKIACCNVNQMIKLCFL